MSNLSRTQSKGGPGPGPVWDPILREIDDFRVLDTVAMSQKSCFLEKTVNLSLFGEKP
jgi:hypothetical protein